MSAVWAWMSRPDVIFTVVGLSLVINAIAIVVNARGDRRG